VATSWDPSTADVASVIPTRVLGTTGTLANFTNDTRPTALQVTELVVTAVREVASAVGSFDPGVVTNPDGVARGDDPITLGDLAREAAKLGAASLVELTFFAEHVNSGRSPYPQLLERQALALSTLRRAVELVVEVQVGDDTPLARATFPERTSPIDVNTGW
jgi:hypothetical protein